MVFTFKLFFFVFTNTSYHVSYVKMEIVGVVVWSPYPHTEKSVVFGNVVHNPLARVQVVVWVFWVVSLHGALVKKDLSDIFVPRRELSTALGLHRLLDVLVWNVLTRVIGIFCEVNVVRHIRMDGGNKSTIVASFGLGVDRVANLQHTT